MPVRVTWYDQEHIVLYTVSDPLTIEDLEQGAHAVSTLVNGIPDLVDMIFDYRGVTELPRKMLVVVREGHFTIPILERVALVGNEPLIEMMFSTITQNTFRPNPSVHQSVEEAAAFLRKMAMEDTNRQ